MKLEENLPHPVLMENPFPSRRPTWELNQPYISLKYSLPSDPTLIFTYIPQENSWYQEMKCLKQCIHLRST